MKPSRRLSVILITLNEEPNLRRCLDSVRFADEIVVVDSGSSDRTCDIALEYTEKVFFHKMHGFGAQKQYALEQATGDWVFSIDSDEWITDQLRFSLQSVLKQNGVQPDYNGYFVYRRNVFLGRSMHYCGWYKPILRLVRKGYGRFNDKLVHEELLVDGPLSLLNGDLMHIPYRDIFHQLEKMQRYAELDAKELIQRGRRVYGWQAPIHLLLRPLWKFLEKYFVQQGFREGAHGLILSWMASFGVFLIHAQCWHLQKLILEMEEDL